ncbi:MAG: hypothetical protein SGBAC_004685 [Bacillariaceae sp.]
MSDNANDTASQNSGTQKFTTTTQENAATTYSTPTAVQPSASSPVTATFSDNHFKIITTLVFMRHTDDRQKEIETFFDANGIDSWDLLKGVKSADLVSGASLPESSGLSKAIFRQRLIQVLDYASIPNTTLSNTLTFQELSEASEQHVTKRSRNTLGSTSPTPQAEDRRIIITVPELPAFSGQVKHYYAWKRKVISLFEQVTLRVVLDDADYHAKNPLTSEACFRAIASALSNGLSKGLVAVQEARNDLSPRNLFLLLVKSFNTPTMQCRFVVAALAHLIQMKPLEHPSSAGSFVTEFRSILCDLQDNGTNLEDMHLVLRSFLIHATEVQGFKTQQNYILEHPKQPIQNYLDRLAKRDTSIPNRTSPPTPREPRTYVQVSDNDVLFARGAKANRQPGNIRYRQEIKRLHPRYVDSKTNSEERVSIEKEIIDSVEQLGGRFLQEDHVKDALLKKHSFGWYVVSPAFARGKVNAALRDHENLERQKVRRDRFLAKKKAAEGK